VPDAAIGALPPYDDWILTMLFDPVNETPLTPAQAARNLQPICRQK
jgi:hypothetical protein